MNRFDSILELRGLLISDGCIAVMPVSNESKPIPAYACDSISFREDENTLSDCSMCVFRNIDKVDETVHEIRRLYDRLREVNAKETD